ncbi:MAG: hypothetical protein K0B52_07110, partial [FCB group bacterium]|nr:hypothetical protein [FCB group bacterium]
MKKSFIFSIILMISGIFLFGEEAYRFINPTFLGNNERNYYGNEAPSRLDIIWRTPLGEGVTKVGEKERVWKGSGWTGQPLLVEKNDSLFIIQSSLDHHLRKICAATGEIKWEYRFSDAVKGTGTLWLNPFATDKETELLIIQGSRRDTRYSTWYQHLHP